MRYRIRSVNGNKFLIEYNEITFFVFVDEIDGRLYVNKPKSIYISNDAFMELIETVLNTWRILNNNENNNNTDNITDSTDAD